MMTLADKSLLSGGDNKPPMLEKHLYDSWKSRIECYTTRYGNAVGILKCLMSSLKNTLDFAHGLYYKVPNVKLEMGLVRVKTADTTIMDGVVAKWRVPPKTRLKKLHFRKKSIEIGLTDQVERTTQEEAVQGEDNQQQQQDNPVEHDNPETAIYVE
ncbi:hypothetical protein Tco_0859563 [Tanacetum coccineum]|uniref:Uncharacterized protein n=1 Tax=Tanacetum coccineum TaxID=301880 RepID=A0ABQ5BD15_9ASTR